MNRNSYVIFFHSLSRAGYYFLLIASMALVLALPTRAEERMAKSKVAPVYPEIARRMKVEGEVKVAVTVDPEGRVVAVKPVSGNHILSEAAQDAVRKWRFESGSGVATFDVGVEFNLAR